MGHCLDLQTALLNRYKVLEPSLEFGNNKAKAVNFLNFGQGTMKLKLRATFNFKLMFGIICMQ